MIRFFATTAILGALVVAPALAQTKTHHRTPYAVHQTPSTDASTTSARRHQHHVVAGDDSAEVLNRQVLQNLQKGG